MFSNSKYFSTGLSVLIHAILFLFLMNYYHIIGEQRNQELVEIGLGNTPGGGNGGEPNVTPQTVEEKIPTNEKKVTTTKTKETEKPKAPEKEGILNNSGIKGSGTGTGTGTGSGNGTGPGTGGGVPIPIPIPKVVPKPVDETYYVAVEQMPEPIGGMGGVYDKIAPTVKGGSAKGTVYILAFIDENGVVRKVMMSKGIGGEADQAAMNAVRRTRFKAGRKAGVTVRVQMLMGIHF